MSEPATARKPLWLDLVIVTIAAVIFISLVGLGNWQLERLSWKLDLIDAVETRAYATPVAPPSGPVSADRHAYLRVETMGLFLHDQTRRVKAVTELGPGYWIMTPLNEGTKHIWINRGFVPAGLSQDRWNQPQGRTRVTGLVRMSEPEGTWLERNKPVEERWYSRDVDALTVAASISRTAPYFIDADHLGNAADWPRGGLTKLNFRNSHLSYAITWYAMAALFLAGMAYVIRERIRSG
ncbi:MAG: SURF1 family protein [Pseudomonadota bacterium]